MLGTLARVLVGRSEELRAAREALERGLAGGPAYLVVRGPSGIGTTALLDELRRQAPPHRAIVVTGHEDERHVPWAGVSQIVFALRTEWSTLDPHPAGTLRTALGLAGGPEPTLAQVAIALLELLATAARDRPLIVWIDDLRWLDPASSDAIAFAARRTAGLAVAVAGAERAAGDGDRARGTDVVDLGPLDDAAGAELLAGLGVTDPMAVASMLAACGGVPLGLVDAVAVLTPAQRSGRDALPNPLPVGSAMAADVAARVAGLSTAARRTLLALAAAAASPPDQVLAAVGGTVEHLELGEAAGLLVLGAGSVAFERPIVRSALYRAATDAERRDVHLALARTLTDPVAAALHAADAAVGPDDTVAMALVGHARDARAHGAAATAVELLRRAHDIAASDVTRHRIDVDAAAAALEAGRTQHARALLDEVPVDQPGRTWLDARCAAAVVSPLEARQRYRRAASEADAGDRTTQCRMLLEAAALSLALYDVDGAAADLDAAPEPDDAELADRLAASRAGVGLLRGVHSDPAPFERAVRQLGRDTPRRGGLASAGAPAPDGLWWAIGVLLPVLNRAGELDRAVEVASAVRRRAAQWGHPELVVAALTEQAKIVARNDFAASEALAREAVELATDVGLAGRLRFALGVWANALAALGSDEVHDATRRLAALGVPLVGDISLAFHHLTHERFEDAITLLEAVDGHPASRSLGILWQADLAEAAWRTGDPDRLERATDDLGRIAAATGFPWARAAELRYRAVQAAGDHQRDLFAQSVDGFERIGADVAAARTRLAWGELARRARRRAEARTQLDLARDAFERAGMHRWSARCDRELAAAGAAVARHEPAPTGLALDALTSHERTVAAQLVGGATYREIAAQLFVSPRTVETHASAIYRKLGVRSRGQLAALARPDTSPSTR